MAILFRTTLWLVARLLAFGAGLSMVLLFLIVLLNALSRYVLGSSLPWGDQVPVFLGIYGVIFGMALAYLQDRHVRLGVILDFLPNRVKERLFLVVDLAVIVVGLLLVWSGYQFMSSRGGMRISGLSSTVRSLREVTGLELLNVFGTLAPYQFAIVLGGALLAVAALLKFIERIVCLRSPTSEVP
ncbi:MULTISPECIES: TRAP transporter small permease [unclassified Halomonas]|uniref:TRAP transporter small permease n=1 Tax=unclassified Halomonas TaxID=2609666 RepID=UPI001CF2AFAE|nr:MULTISPECIES: TRAP transporter small permease subunit [unclassified Halomonas]UZH10025.1 TRAP transporter small permease subunit [Halomonas sp. BDJS001]